MLKITFSKIIFFFLINKPKLSDKFLKSIFHENQIYFVPVLSQERSWNKFVVIENIISSLFLKIVELKIQLTRRLIFSWRSCTKDWLKPSILVPFPEKSRAVIKKWKKNWFFRNIDINLKTFWIRLTLNLYQKVTSLDLRIAFTLSLLVSLPTCTYVN